MKAKKKKSSSGNSSSHHLYRLPSDAAIDRMSPSAYNLTARSSAGFLHGKENSGQTSGSSGTDTNHGGGSSFSERHSEGSNGGNPKTSSAPSMVTSSSSGPARKATSSSPMRNQRFSPASSSSSRPPSANMASHGGRLSNSASSAKGAGASYGSRRGHEMDDVDPEMDPEDAVEADMDEEAMEVVAVDSDEDGEAVSGSSARQFRHPPSRKKLKRKSGGGYYGSSQGYSHPAGPISVSSRVSPRPGTLRGLELLGSGPNSTSSTPTKRSASSSSMDNNNTNNSSGNTNSANTTSSSSSTTSANNRHGPRCSNCLEIGSVDQMKKCSFCKRLFHLKCINFKLIPQKNDFFCRWSCFSNFHKKNTEFLAASAAMGSQNGPNGVTPTNSGNSAVIRMGQLDFVDLAYRVEDALKGIVIENVSVDSSKGHFKNNSHDDPAMDDNENGEGPEDDAHLTSTQSTVGGEPQRHEDDFASVDLVSASHVLRRDPSEPQSGRSSLDAEGSEPRVSTSSRASRERDRASPRTRPVRASSSIRHRREESQSPHPRQLEVGRQGVQEEQTLDQDDGYDYIPPPRSVDSIDTEDCHRKRPRHSYARSPGHRAGPAMENMAVGAMPIANQVFGSRTPSPMYRHYERERESPKPSMTRTISPGRNSNASMEDQRTLGANSSHRNMQFPSIGAGIPSSNSRTTPPPTLPTLQPISSLFDKNRKGPEPNGSGLPRLPLPPVGTAPLRGVSGSSSHGELPSAAASLNSLRNERYTSPLHRDTDARRASHRGAKRDYSVDSEHRRPSPRGPLELDPLGRGIGPIRGGGRSHSRSPHGDRRSPHGERVLRAPVSEMRGAGLPWMTSSSSFPSSLYERFTCEVDDLNGVFRIDLSPALEEKRVMLFQNEIDFFFRCFESSEGTLVVKGLASDLNPHLWTFPYLLESCRGNFCFQFDHFQLLRPECDIGEAELEYLGKLSLPMAEYWKYVDKYLAASEEVLFLDVSSERKSLSLVPIDNVIVLNDLVLMEWSTQLHADLMRSFQWDVFAGGIHCLLQYLSPKSRHAKFQSPKLHINFPGARSAVRDSGNGTTDTAYQVLTGCLELIVFERLESRERAHFVRLLKSTEYDPIKKPLLSDVQLRELRAAGYAWSTFLVSAGEFVHVNKGRMHCWRVVDANNRMNTPCVFLSWEWVYQGVSQRGISTECWFTMKCATAAYGEQAFDPRRAVVEATKRGLSVIRAGESLINSAATSLVSSVRFLPNSWRSALMLTSSSTTANSTLPPTPSSTAGSGAPTVLGVDTGGSSRVQEIPVMERKLIQQRQNQMVLFLESILPCLDALVEEELDAYSSQDDSEELRRLLDEEVAFKVVDAEMDQFTVGQLQQLQEFSCGICQMELTNSYKQCIGCTLFHRQCRANMHYDIFRVCFRCFANASRHHFHPRKLHSSFETLLSSQGHTGYLSGSRRHRRAVEEGMPLTECDCAPSIQCINCGGCESCSCVCHTLFQTRFRFEAPEFLNRLRTNVMDVIEWHKKERR